MHYGPPGLYRVVHRGPESVRVAFVLAVEDAAGVYEAARTWMEQTHRNWHVMLAGPESVLADAMAELRRAGIGNHRIRSCVCEGVDRHTALARAAAAADADQLVLMQTPAAGLTEDWVARLIGYSGQPGVGAAGPIQLGANGRIQEAGVALPTGWPLPLLYGSDSSMDDHFGYGTSVYNVRALSGMLATSAEARDRAGGLRSELAELSLVDYCLRLGDRGERIVIVPDARLQITGHDRTMNDLQRLDRLRREPGRSDTGDPFYNPLLRTDRGDFSWR